MTAEIIHFPKCHVTRFLRKLRSIQDIDGAKHTYETLLKYGLSHAETRAMMSHINDYHLGYISRSDMLDNMFHSITDKDNARVICNIAAHVHTIK